MDEFSDGKAIFLKPDAIQYDKDGNEMAHWRFDVPAPKRQWVGLTEQDVHDAFQFTELIKQLSFDRERPEWCENFAAYIEAKLKEKNT
jgi:hypothetical protein